MRRGRFEPFRGLLKPASTVVLAIMAAGCTGGSTTQPSDRQSPASTSAPLSTWQTLGATEVPPTSLKQVTLGNIKVVNQTGGAVSEPDARNWATAYLREYGYLNWAVNHGQDAFLLHSGLSSIPLAVFQPDLADITEARQSGDRVEWRSPIIRRLAVRTVPQSLQAFFQNHQFTWKPYAIYVDQVGPSTEIWIDAHGHRTVRFQVPAGVATHELAGGELDPNSLMGDVWAPSSDLSCDDVHNSQLLGPLCSTP
jgi:hypothetical protein